MLNPVLLTSYQVHWLPTSPRNLGNLSTLKNVLGVRCSYIKGNFFPAVLSSLRTIYTQPADCTSPDLGAIIFCCACLLHPESQSWQKQRQTIINSQTHRKPCIKSEGWPCREMFAICTVPSSETMRQCGLLPVLGSVQAHKCISPGKHLHSYLFLKSQSHEHRWSQST